MTENQDNPLPRDRHRATACGGRKTTIAFVLYERFAILDLAAPVDVLQAWPNAEFVFVAESTELVRADSGLLVAPTASLSDLQAADLIVVPGTDDPRALTRKHALTEWTRRAAETATWISSVCTGAFLLGEAGILRGREATTHWAYRHRLARYGATVSEERVVFDGNLVTSAGVSAGIDMALSLLAAGGHETRAKLTELVLEYDPVPPFGCGTPAKADRTLTQVAKAALRAREFNLAGRPKGVR